MEHDTANGPDPAFSVHRRDSDRLSALIAAQQEIASVAPDPQAIMQWVATRAQELTGADGATVELVEGEEMVYRAAAGLMARCAGLRFQIAGSFSGLCVRTEDILRCDDALTDPRLEQDVSHLRTVRSMVVVPLRYQLNSVGVLKVFSREPAAFVEADVQTLQLVAYFMAMAVNQAVTSGAKQALLAEHSRTILALRDSEERFRSAFDYAAIGMGLVGTDGRWRKVNRALCEIVGYSESELLSRTLGELSHPEEFNTDSVELRKLLAGEIRTIQSEKRYVHKSGSIVWIFLSVSLLRDAQGKPLYFIAQIQDITERKRAEEARARLTAILEATTDFVGTVDVDGRTLYLNRAFRELAGLGPHEDVSSRHFSEFHPRWAAEVIAREGLPRAIREGAWSGETALVGRNRREIPISQLIIAHRGPRGEVAYYSMVARDITERKRAEQALIMQARVLQNMSEGVCLTDEDGTIVYTNAAEETMFGFGPGELIGQQLSNLNYCSGDESQRAIAQILEQVRSKGTWTGELTNRRKEATAFTTAASISLLEISGRRYFVCVQADITEKKRADEQIKNSLKEKEVLLKEVHHRVKNNLQVISSLLNLQAGYIRDPGTQELFRDSQNRVHTMALIHEKLYQSQDLARIDFGEYILNLVSMLFRSYGTHTGSVRVESRIDQVFLNVDTAITVGLIINELVSNSLKYAFPQNRPGTIFVDFRSVNSEQLTLVFRDNGVGVPKDFDFDKSPSLGLRLVKILTTQIGGELSFNRTNGTEFTINFKERKDKARK